MSLESSEDGSPSEDGVMVVGFIGGEVVSLRDVSKVPIDIK